MELLFDSNCDSSFLEKRGCSHALILKVGGVCGWNMYCVPIGWGTKNCTSLYNRQQSQVQFLVPHLVHHFLFFTLASILLSIE